MESMEQCWEAGESQRSETFPHCLSPNVIPLCQGLHPKDCPDPLILSQSLFWDYLKKWPPEHLEHLGLSVNLGEEVNRISTASHPPPPPHFFEFSFFSQFLFLKQFKLFLKDRDNFMLQVALLWFIYLHCKCREGLKWPLSTLALLVFPLTCIRRALLLSFSFIFWTELDEKMRLYPNREWCLDNSDHYHKTEKEWGWKADILARKIHVFRILGLVLAS